MKFRATMSSICERKKGLIGRGVFQKCGEGESFKGIERRQQNMYSYTVHRHTGNVRPPAAREI
jgi:hypothetical protein